MRILSHSVALPSRRVTNVGVVEHIAELSRDGFDGDLDRMLQQIEFMLRRSGAATRYWRDKGETSLELTLKAGREALCGYDGAPVDTLICAGVYTELREPSSAAVIANKLGLDNVRCFDLKQACDGWSNAMDVAAALIESGRRQCVMVINAEFAMTEGMGVYPKLFKLEQPEQLEHRFPGYTLGEAAAAMIVGADPDNQWSFHNKTRNDLWDLCTITMPWYKDQPLGSSRLAKDGPEIFTSYGVDLRHHGLPAVVETFNESGVDSADVDVLFTHSSSKSDWREAAKRIGLANKIYDIYAEFGNVVSAAVPAAMGIARDRKALKRGMKVDTLVASAGMSFTNIAFTY